MSTDVNGYKVEPSADTDNSHSGNPHQHPQHPHSAQQSHTQQHHQPHQQQHAPGGHQAQSHPRSNIHQAQGTNSYPSPHQPPQHPGHYQAPPPHHQQQDNLHFYQPYGAPAANHGQYSNSGPDMMAHNMNRPYPPMYHTPQSNSPASVASPTGPDPRSVYSTPPIPQQMYGYPQQYAPISAPTSQYPHPQQHGIPSQPLLMSQAPGQSITPPAHQQQHMQHPQHNIANPAPRTQQIAKNNTVHRASPAAPATNTTSTTNNTQTTNGGGSGTVNPNAAPGPIPATTPLVVRQDNNGVQWIAFEYSRDRVKMEYTIRCDVESVNVDTLSHDFKTENCVYPRACCPKDQYRGNRLVYETECNNVGWALAELNPCLRGKRGLIQRAVDSWRNSNQDQKLRSRRVRRMAKINSRKANAANAHPSQVGQGSSVHAVANTSNGMGIGLKAEDGAMGTMMHHHHNPATAHYGPVGSMPSAVASRSTSGHLSPAVGEEFNANGNHHHHHHHHQNPSGAPEDIRARPQQVFHGYPSYPSQPMNGASMAPDMHNGVDAMGVANNQPNSVSTSAPAANAVNNDTQNLFGDVPNKRKFILVDDPHRGSRVRVRVMLDQVQMQEIPDSYRKSNSVYPRAYVSDIDGSSRDINDDTLHTTQISVNLLDGSHMNVSAPPPPAGKRRKERQLNELGYRMSWSQSRVFAGRTMFLQRALDAYRNKMRSSMMGSGQDVTVSAPHLETRAGKRKWLDRQRRSAAKGGASGEQ